MASEQRFARSAPPTRPAARLRPSSLNIHSYLQALPRVGLCSGGWHGCFDETHLPDLPLSQWTWVSDHADRRAYMLDQCVHRVTLR